MTVIAGLDEAGKGPVIGPMVVAGAAFKEEHIPELDELGLRDSKLHTPRQRELLAKKIRGIASCHELVLSAAEIDARRERQTLNEIAVDMFADVLDVLKPDSAFVDAPDVNPQRFVRNLDANVSVKINITSEHGADAKYPVVSAASIIAKVRRDAEIEKIKRDIGYDFGSGYPSDAKTVDFLRLMLKKGKLPDYVRHSWKTVMKLRKENEQRNIGDY